MERFPFNRKQLAVVVALIVAFFLVMDLNSRINDLFRLSAQRDQMQAEVNSLTKTKVMLKTQIAFATSDAFVAEWAREQAGFGKPGDIPIIPLPQQDFTPVPQTAATPTIQPVEHWEKWWALFFGK
jgi:cell division protein FtsB